MNESKPLIVMTGGGSAGPVTPLIAVAQALAADRPDWRFLWIGTRSGPERALVERAGIDFLSISSDKLRRYFSWQTIVAPFFIAVGFFQAFSIFGRERPGAVVSAGGFVAAPVIWAAWLRRVPVHIHQQDLRPTLTNVITAPFAASASVAFEKSLEDFRRLSPEHTGNPVRSAILSGSREKAAEIFGLEPGLPTVLVVGGGTGAAGLNGLTVSALSLLTDAVQVVHVTGRGKADIVGNVRRYHQHELLIDEMPHALAAADLVVSRAGIGTLSELAVLGKPTVIIPMPGTHQEDNAEYFAAHGAGVHLREQELFSKSFADAILGLIFDRARLAELGAAIRKLNDPAAAKRVADMVVRLIEKS
jgi:UDP-N-acetylglucosamine--N-acetylmuramyl-(pentapeptide) pyrophosphoryl-undecaprenol N-acetylglucosamine transferase